jgi:hypothetical protein
VTVVDDDRAVTVCGVRAEQRGVGVRVAPAHDDDDVGAVDERARATGERGAAAAVARAHDDVRAGGDRR